MLLVAVTDRETSEPSKRSVEGGFAGSPLLFRQRQDRSYADCWFDVVRLWLCGRDHDHLLVFNGRCRFQPGAAAAVKALIAATLPVGLASLLTPPAIISQFVDQPHGWSQVISPLPLTATVLSRSAAELLIRSPFSATVLLPQVVTAVLNEHVLLRATHYPSLVSLPEPTDG